MLINREDMLELTRRMTLKRNCFTRLAGAYVDEEGFVDDTFNINFLNLSAPEKNQNLEIAKTIPFAKTNEELRDYRFRDMEWKDKEQLKKILLELNRCNLKNDALLFTLYDYFVEKIKERGMISGAYAIYMFSGTYDVPLKAKDKESLMESEEVYSFLVGAICPLKGEYDPDLPIAGFLFPTFTDRSSDSNGIAIFKK